MAALNELASRLQKIRAEMGLSQAEMAAALGVSRMTYGYYENAKRTPDVEFLNSVYTFIGYTMEYLLGVSPYKTTTEEIQARDLAAEGTASGEAVQYAVRIMQTTRLLLDKHANEGEPVLRDFLRPLATICELTAKFAGSFNYAENGETRKFYADRIDEFNALYRQARHVPIC